MTAVKHYLVHLRPGSQEDRWVYLHQLFHPGSLAHDKRATLYCTALEPSTAPGLLRLVAKNFQEGGALTVHIPLDLLEAAVEFEARRPPPGFVDPGDDLAR